MSWVWWHKPAVLAHRKRWQKDMQFQISMGVIFLITVKNFTSEAAWGRACSLDSRCEILSITAREAQRQELEVAASIASVCTCSVQILLFVQSGTPAVGWCSHIRGVAIGDKELWPGLNHDCLLGCWASGLISLCLSFPIYKIEIVINLHSGILRLRTITT